MTPGVSEDLEQDPACAVHDGRLLVEVRSRGNVSRDRENSLDTIERAECRLEHGQRVEGTDLGGSIALGDADRVAERADAGELTFDSWELPRCPGDAVVDHDRVEGIVRGMRTVENQTEVIEP